VPGGQINDASDLELIVGTAVEASEIQILKL